MSVSTVVETIQHHRAAAIIRASDSDTAVEIGRAIIRGGLPVVEVSFNTPGALDAIRELATDDTALIGAGTVFDPADVEKVVDAGGQFMVTPNFNPDVVRAGLDAGLVVGPGVFTPTECYGALSLGAHFLKLFPATSAGISAMRSMSDPFPEARWLASGGISRDNIMEWLDAGADAVGIGSTLTSGGVAEAEQRTRDLLAIIQSHQP
jgi:2-dehydro-3-deoxyphosphogluconate aldolase/(4S)-4-hydroxy-2-oxoglutarate aldolase